MAAFPLRTDYRVFLCAPIEEAHDGELSTRAALARGLERAGRLVTTVAAPLLCVAIGASATSHVFFAAEVRVVAEVRFGAALALAADPGVIRALLVPALMGRIGPSEATA